MLGLLVLLERYAVELVLARPLGLKSQGTILFSHVVLLLLTGIASLLATFTYLLPCSPLLLFSHSTLKHFSHSPVICLQAFSLKTASVNMSLIWQLHKMVFAGLRFVILSFQIRCSSGHAGCRFDVPVGHPYERVLEYEGPRPMGSSRFHFSRWLKWGLPLFKFTELESTKWTPMKRFRASNLVSSLKLRCFQ